jgi:ABC-2 type transport system ATP-binding protein
MEPPAILVKGLVKRFGETAAVDGLDLDIAPGTFYGLLGPNGAGKSTTVGMLTGTLRPTAGTIELFGRRFDPDQPSFRALMGVVPEDPPLFERLRGLEQLLFSGRMYGLPREEAMRRAQELLALLRLDDHPRTLIADYSRGMRKKLAIAAALIHAPKLLFFDEPFENVDALSSETIRRVLVALTGRGATVLLTTHILEIAEKICERIGILHRGKLAYQADRRELLSRHTDLGMVFRQVVGEPDAPEALPRWLVGGPGGAAE